MPAGGITFLSLELGLNRGRWPLGDSGVGGQGWSGCGAESWRRGCAGCMWKNHANVNCHTTGARERRAALRKGGGSPGCYHRPKPRASPARPARTRDFLLSFFLARWCSFGRDSFAECRSRGAKGIGGRGWGRSQRHTSLQSQPWEVRPQDSDCSCQGDIFSPSSQVPASSANPACGLPVYFSPNRLPGGHGISAWTGIGREFRIWRRPCWSLSEWSVFPSPHPTPDPLRFRLWADFEGAFSPHLFLALGQFFAHCPLIIMLCLCRTVEFCIRY